MEKNKKTLILFVIFGIIIMVVGTTLAYFRWQSAEEQKTVVNFTIGSDFSCAADGGGDITSGTINLIPTEVNDNTTANYIKREVKVMPTIAKEGKTIYMNLWLDIKKLDSGLSGSSNLMYVLNTSSTDKDTGVVSSGNFYGKLKGDRINLLGGKSYDATTSDTYYLWIWLDAAETSSSTMNQSFELSLNGMCNDTQPANAPVLDDGMIPVVISNDGTVTTVSKDNASWYNYNNKEWANVVLVNSSSRSNYLNTTGVTVSEDDILAYYVWIPRYSYKIPVVSCSTINNPTVDNNPSCYNYILSDSDKTLLINWWQSYNDGYLDSYTLEQATNDINKGLNTGSFILHDPEFGNVTVNIKEVITSYNERNDTDISYTTKFNSSNIIKDKPSEIDILFENKNADKQNGDAIDTYHTHSAFTFGGTELSGIWAGKFETTGTEDSPTIKDNNTSLVSQKVSKQFSTAQLFGGTGYGSTSKVDSHMMKNSEWGAVAYLSHSKYGVNEEIRINNYNNNNNEYLTGCGASTADASSSTNCEIVYGNASEYPQSTTGNITGIFDMSGGAWEYVMGYYSGASTTWGATSSSNYADFSNTPDSKYYDDYATINALTACNGGICYGHGLSEVSSWYGDDATFVNAHNPWFKRGGDYSIGSIAGAFCFDFDAGGGDYHGSYGFRAVLVNVGV